jgi:hypothetical protein
MNFKEVPIDKPFAMVEGDFVKILVKEEIHEGGKTDCRPMTWDGKVPRVSESVVIGYGPEWANEPVLMVEGNVSYQ